MGQFRGRLRVVLAHASLVLESVSSLESSRRAMSTLGGATASQGRHPISPAFFPPAWASVGLPPPLPSTIFAASPTILPECTPAFTKIVGRRRPANRLCPHRPNQTTIDATANFRPHAINLGADRISARGRHDADHDFTHPTVCAPAIKFVHGAAEGRQPAFFELLLQLLDLVLQRFDPVGQLLGLALKLARKMHPHVADAICNSSSAAARR